MTQAATVNVEAPGPATETTIRRLTADAIFAHKQALSMLVALLGFLAFVLPGGYWVSATATRLALLSLTPALLALRPWRSLGGSPLTVGLAWALGATLVFFAHGMAGEGATYRIYYELLVFLLVAHYASTMLNRRRVIGALFVCAVCELAIAGWTWWKGGDPTALLKGTVHWHNQLAAFLLVPATIGSALYVEARMSRRWSAVGLLIAGLASTGIVLTTSRAGLALLVLAWFGAAILIPRATSGRSALLRWLSVPAVVVTFTRLATGGWLFPHHSYTWPLLGEGGRGTSTMAGNTTARLTYVEAAAHIFQHNLILGSGFNSYPSAATQYLPPGTPSIFGVYNAWVDALMAGGLVYGLPVLAVGVAAALLTWRLMRSLPRVHTEAAIHLGIALAVLSLYGHLAFDADTYYPQVMTMAAAVTGLAWASVDALSGVAPAATP